jgi:S1-C subfamily serine protease
VMVIGKDGFGSGALITADGKIITNLHVVEDAETVGVVFKPATEGAGVGEADVHKAKVIRRDGIADLALLQVSEVPTGHAPLKLASGTAPSVGSDVHAIGHPTGEAWTYTHGIVSQVRQDYSWHTEDKVEHKATVIQTQTPMNPGNSGGPLLNDEMEIVGLNSFIGDGEGINFAVSALDVQAMLAMTADRAAPAPVACEVKEMGSEPRKKPKGVLTSLDTNCDGEVDMLVEVPDSKSEAIIYYSDTDGDGKIDAVLVDDGHDDQLDYAMYDTDGDGKMDMEGFYDKGDEEPSRFQKIKN